jgi:hypothetical protein
MCVTKQPLDRGYMSHRSRTPLSESRVNTHYYLFVYLFALVCLLLSQEFPELARWPLLQRVHHLRDDAQTAMRLRMRAYVELALGHAAVSVSGEHSDVLVCPLCVLLCLLVSTSCSLHAPHTHYTDNLNTQHTH